MTLPSSASLSHSEERYSQGFSSAVFTHPSQILWTGSSNFTQVQVLPAGNVKITCDFKANLMCWQTVVLQNANSLIKAGLRNAEIQHQKMSKLKGVQEESVKHQLGNFTRVSNLLLLVNHGKIQIV